MIASCNVNGIGVVPASSGLVVLILSHAPCEYAAAIQADERGSCAQSMLRSFR